MHTETTLRSPHLQRLRNGSYRHPLYSEGLDSYACAQHYETMQHAPERYSVEVSYVHFKHQTIAQYADLINSGLAVDYYHEGDFKYDNSAAMLDDLDQGHLWSLLTDTKNHGLPADHPMLEPVVFNADPNQPTLLLNDIFRVVHDALGHGGAQSSFSLSGELEAWKAHRTHYSQDALAALWCETRGQSAWTNRYANHDQLPLKDRPFATQKAGSPGHRYI